MASESERVNLFETLLLHKTWFWCVLGTWHRVSGNLVSDEQYLLRWRPLSFSTPPPGLGAVKRWGDRGIHLGSSPDRYDYSQQDYECS